MTSKSDFKCHIIYLARGMFPAIYRCSWRNDTVQRSAAKNKFFIVLIEFEFAYQTEKQNNADVIFEITRARHHFALKVYLSKHNALVLIYILYMC